MGNKLRNTTSYETVVQLLALAAVILAPFMAFNFMDLELFSVSKSMFIALRSSINPWLCPPYVYIVINFIIVFIAALSFIHSNTIIYDSTNDQNQNPNASFIDSSLISQSLDEVHEPLVDDDDFKVHDLKFHKFEDTFKSQEDYMKSHKSESMPKERHNKLEDMFKLDQGDNHSKVKKLEEVVHESVVDKRELRKSRTFHEGGSRSRGRKERYVRILSQEELDQRVEAFINKFKKT